MHFKFPTSVMKNYCQMKICHLLPGLIVGGAERVAIDLANAAAAVGHDVTLLLVFPVDKGPLEARISPRVTIRYMTESRRGRWYRYLASLFWIVRNWPWVIANDVLHCHLTQPAILGSLVWIMKRIMGGAHTVVVETYHAVGMPIPFWHRWGHQFLARWRDAFILMAEDKHWYEFSRPNQSLLVKTIPNGVSVGNKEVSAQEIELYRLSASIPPSCQMVVGNVGQFRPDRKPHLIAEIFIKIAQRTNDDVHFLLVGDGVELEAVRATIKSFGLDARIHTPGLALQPLLPMSLMDLYVVPNIGPITGVAGLEAALIGIPLIALQWDATYTCTANDWIWSHHDKEKIVSRAVELLEDKMQRAELAARQQSHAKLKFSVDAMFEAYMGVYQQAIERAG